MSQPVSSPSTSPLLEGEIVVGFALDLGFQVDLEAASRLLDDATRLEVVRARRPSPPWFDYNPAPLRILIGVEPLSIGDHRTLPHAEVLLYDFGAAVVSFRLPLSARLDDLPALAVLLDGNESLEKAARRCVEDMLVEAGPAVERPLLAAEVEDYTIYCVQRWEGEAHALLETHRATLAQVIEADRVDLADEQVARATKGVMSYSKEDLALVAWNAAVLLDPNPEDVVTVLLHANVELLELRVLDRELDRILDQAHLTLAVLGRRRLWPGFASDSMLRRYAAVQTEAAVLFEGVHNAIKLVGNQYLARFYRLVAGRLDLAAWQADVQRKLEAANDLYEKMADSTATRRLEILEWVIIVLIMISIVLPFTPWYGAH